MKTTHFILVALLSITLSPIRIQAEYDSDEKDPPTVPVQDAIIQGSSDGPSPNGDYGSPAVQPIYNAPGPAPVTTFVRTQSSIDQYGAPVQQYSYSGGFTGGNGQYIQPNLSPGFTSGYSNNGPSFSTFPVINPAPIQNNLIIRDDPVPLPRPIPGPTYGSPRFIQSQQQPIFNTGSGFGGGYSNNYQRPQFQNSFGVVGTGRYITNRVVSPGFGYGAPNNYYRQPTVGFGSITSVNYNRFNNNNNYQQNQGGYAGGFNYRNNYQFVRPAFSGGGYSGPSFSSGSTGGNFGSGFTGGNFGSGSTGGVSGGYA